MHDPILIRLGVFFHRCIIFFFLWLVSLGTLCYLAFDGANRSLRDWWDLFSIVTGPDCPPQVWHLLEFLGVIAALPVIMIFIVLSAWWKRQGLASLRAQSGIVEK